MFYSARPITSSMTASGRALTTKQYSSMRLRVHFIAASLSIIDDEVNATLPINVDSMSEFNELCMSVNDAVIVLCTTVTTNTSTLAIVSTSTKIDMSLNDINIFEAIQSKSSFISAEQNSLIPQQYPTRRVFLNFYQLQNSGLVYGAPHCEISVDISPLKTATITTTQIAVSVKLEPLIVSAVYSHLMKWSTVLSKFVVNVSTDESSSVFSFVLKIPKIDTFVHADPSISIHVWKDLLQALGLDSPQSSALSANRNSRWHAIDGNDSIRYDRQFLKQLDYHLENSDAGFRFQVLNFILFYYLVFNLLFSQWKDVSVCYRSPQYNNETKDSEVSEVEISDLLVSAFIAKRTALSDTSSPFAVTRIFEANLLQASADEHLLHKVTVTRKKPSNSDSRPPDDQLPVAPLGPAAPYVEPQNILYIHANRIIIGCE